MNDTIKNQRGTLIVLSGPSGVGKSTVIAELLSERKDIYFSVSYTTRSPRPGEVDGVDYHFVDRAGCAAGHRGAGRVQGESPVP